MEAEASAEDGGALIPAYVHDFRGFRDGGGQIQHTRTSLRNLLQKMNWQRWKTAKKNLETRKPA